MQALVWRHTVLGLAVNCTHTLLTGINTQTHFLLCSAKPRHWPRPGTLSSTAGFSLLLSLKSFRPSKKKVRMINCSNICILCVQLVWNFRGFVLLFVQGRCSRRTRGWLAETAKQTTASVRLFLKKTHRFCREYKSLQTGVGGLRSGRSRISRRPRCCTTACTLRSWT